MSARTSVVLPAPDGAAMTMSLPLGPGRAMVLLDVLDLLAHLLDEHLQLHRGPRGLGIAGFRAEGVGLAIELLPQEVQPPAHRLVAPERAAQRLDVAIEPVELLLHVHLLGDD